MNNLIRYLGISLSLFSVTAWSEVVQVEYLDIKGAPTVKYASPYYINPQSSFSAAVTAGVGRHIMLEVKNTKGDLVFTQSKSRVENKDTFVVKGVTYFGAKFDVTKLDDGQYTLTSVVSDGQIEVSRQTSALTVDTKTPAILGDFYWQHFGSYAYKHSDNKFIISPVHGSDAGFPSIDPGTSGFSHGTFSSEYLDGPKAGTFHAQNLPLLLTNQGKIIIGNGNLDTITTAHIPDNIANQMRLTYTIFNKVGASSSRSVDVYVATRKAPRPEPYGIFTGVSSQLDNKPVFTGFVPYVPGMTIPNNPVRMLYRAPKEFYLGGGGNAEIYGSWLNGSRKPNRVVHIDDHYVYFDLTGSTDGKGYGNLQHYTRDVSTWRNHFFNHDLVVPSNLAPPKSTGFSFFVQGKNQWLNSDVAHYRTKFDTNGATDLISKIRVQVEPRAYEQRFSYDFRNTGNSTRFGNCIIPASGTECTIDTSLPFPGDDLHYYHNRHMITNLANTLFSPEIVSSWRYDGSIAELDPASIVNDSVNKTITFSVIDKFKERAIATSTVRVMDAFAVNPFGVRRKLTRTKYISTPLTSSDQLFTATYSYSGLPDGTYSFEGYVEDGFSGLSMRNKTNHVLFTERIIDTTPPKISTNISGGSIKALRSIEIKLIDTSESSIKSAILTGGKDNVNISLPIVNISSKNFRPEHIYITPSETLPYTITVKALDAFGNESTHVENFFYVPVIIKLPEIAQPAISSPLKSASGMPSNVIQTPQVKNPLGELAQGNHEAIFTVLPTATSGMIINGQLILPGEAKHFMVNLSQTNHRLTFEAYPAVSGQELTNQFEINLPDVRVSLCPATFELKSEQCISVNFTNPELKCSTPYALNNGSCELKIEYAPTAECLSGYTLFGTVCKGTYSVAPIKKCPSDFSRVNDGTCNQVLTKPLKVCADDEVAEDAFCKTSSGTTVPQKAYCDGIDVSGGSFCDGAKCYTYKPDWNACQITHQAPSSDFCQVGTYTSGTCQVSDEYTLNMQCPFGYNRDGLLCKRLEITPPLKSCQQGFELSGDICVKTEYSQFISCPSTHYLLGGLCHEKRQINIVCPSGYTWLGEKCTKYEQSNATPFCPDGSSLNGSSCNSLTTVPASINCSAGTYPENGVCISRSSESATPVCPSGFDLNGNSCISTESQDPNLVCPQGSSYDMYREVCLTLVSTNEIECPRFYEPVFRNSEWMCRTGKLGMSEFVDFWDSCPSGQIFDVSRDGSRPFYSCYHGQTRVNECPSGWMMNGNFCTRTITTSPVAYTCLPGQILDGQICNSLQSYEPESYTCPTGSLVGTNCHITTTSPVIYKCPPSWVNDGSLCKITLYQDENRLCDPSHIKLDDNFCYSNQPTLSIGGCPPGFSQNATHCSKSLTSPLNFSCSPSFDLIGEQCHKMLTQSVSVECQPEETFEGVKCVMTRNHLPVPLCPTPYQLENPNSCKNEIVLPKFK